ncbi:MAG TPA: DUF1127 domain-containing protein [Xanthobacteraceae bacterium]|nr:DUF1127 domain-containing protein [Xanthobacteraceae bacterium]
MLLWGYVARQVRRWHAYRRTLAELSVLDDRTLADIAISRGDIGSVARRAAAAVA